MNTEQRNLLAFYSSAGLEQVRRFKDATNDRDIGPALRPCTSFYHITVIINYDAQVRTSESGRKIRDMPHASAIGTLV